MTHLTPEAEKFIRENFDFFRGIFFKNKELSAYAEKDARMYKNAIDEFTACLNANLDNPLQFTEEFFNDIQNIDQLFAAFDKKEIADSINERYQHLSHVANLWKEYQYSAQAQTKLDTKVEQNTPAAAETSKQYTAIVCWDMDGVINDMSEAGKTLRKMNHQNNQKMPYYYPSTEDSAENYEDIYIPNAPYLRTVMEILEDNNVKSVVASQRNTYYLSANTNFRRTEMFQAYDGALGKDRLFLIEADADVIVAKGRGRLHDNDSNKVWILDAANDLAGCSTVKPENKILIDDSLRYEKPAKNKGYQFVHVADGSQEGHKEYLGTLLVKTVPAEKIFEGISQRISNGILTQEMGVTLAKTVVTIQLKLSHATDKQLEHISEVAKQINSKQTELAPLRKKLVSSLRNAPNFTQSLQDLVKTVSQFQSQAMPIYEKATASQSKLKDYKYDDKATSPLISDIANPHRTTSEGKLYKLMSPEKDTLTGYMRAVNSFISSLEILAEKIKPTRGMRIANFITFGRAYNKEIQEYKYLTNYQGTLDKKLTTLKESDYCTYMKEKKSSSAKTIFSDNDNAELKTKIDTLNSDISGLNEKLDGLLKTESDTITSIVQERLKQTQPKLSSENVAVVPEVKVVEPKSEKEETLHL